MAAPNSWIHNICRFLTYCRRTLSGGIGENRLQLDLPERVLGLLHGTREMPHNCRLFLGFVNILTVAIVVGLAMENTSQDGPMLEEEDDHDQIDGSGVQKEDQNTKHGIQKLTGENSALSITKEDVQNPEASKAHERAEGTSTASKQCRAVCNYCTASAKKAVRLLTECGYSGGEEHIVRFTGCRFCGGVDNTKEAIRANRVNLPLGLESVSTTGGDLDRAAQGESSGRSRDVQEEDRRDPVQTPVTFYWRNRVLDILAPSLQPLPHLFHDSGNMNEADHITGGNVIEGHQGNYGSGGLEHEITHERSHTQQPQDHVANSEATPDIANNLETILESDDNHDANQSARIGTQETDSFCDDSLTEQQNSPQIRVEIQFPASVLSSQPSNYNSQYPGSSTVFATRPATPPQADRNDSYSNAPIPQSRSVVVIYNPTSTQTRMAQPEYNNAQELEDYNYNRDPGFTDAFSLGGSSSSAPPHSSSSDDDEFGFQPSSSFSSRSFRSWSTPVASGRPHLHSSSTAARERLRPRARALARRPRCGLRMMKALRDDPSCTPEEGKTRRQPGREDKVFSPKRGDVICRHTVVPGRGVVEMYFPGIEEHLQDGDSLVRMKMDNKSYPTMLIVSAKAYLFLQGKWMYMGRHEHGVRKTKRERLPG